MRSLPTATTMPLRAAAARMQRLQRHDERVRGTGDVDRRGCGHPRQQLSGGVVHLRDHGVGHDVVHGRRIDAYLRHDAVEDFVRICQDREIDVLPRADRADVRLADGDVDFHVREILRDREERRRLEAGGDRLSDGDVARDDGAVYRRRDDRAREIELVLLNDRLLCGDVGLRGVGRSVAACGGRRGLRRLRLRRREGRLRGDERVLVRLDLRASDVALREQILIARQHVLCERERAAIARDRRVRRRDTRLIRGGYVGLRGDLILRLGERCLGLVELRLQRARVEAREHLALVHDAVVVDVDLGDRSGNLRADADGVLGIDRSRCRDALDERLLNDGSGDVRSRCASVRDRDRREDRRNEK